MQQKGRPRKAVPARQLADASNHEQRTILQVGRLPTSTVNELRASKTDERHAHLNSLLED
jgi:hypothetical protein